MNQPPSRHPLFVAIACIALVGAWSTGAHEAETGESVALLAPQAPASPSMATGCQAVLGPTRALCLFEASRPSSLLAVREPALLASPSGAAAASSLRIATRPLPSGLVTP